MHKEILIKEQAELLPLLKKFSKDFGLVGGTAIALHLGHRRSVDFDLFSFKEFNNLNINKKISRVIKIDEIFVNKIGEFTISVNRVHSPMLHFTVERHENIKKE